MLGSAALTACLSLGWLGVSQAQPVSNRVLSGYQIASGGGCSIYKINFNFRIRYDSHFPVTSGNQLRILFRPVDPREFVLQGGFEREALRPPQDRHTAIKAIEYEARIAESPALTIVFDKQVQFSAAGGADFQSLIVSVGGKGCKPVFPQVADSWQPEGSQGGTPAAKRAPAPETVVGKWTAKPVDIPDVAETKAAPVAVAKTGEPAAAPSKVIGPTSVTGPTEDAGAAKSVDANGSAQEAAAATLIGEARTSLKQNNFQTAIGFLKKAAQLPENRRSPEARELLGVAYQKDKQAAAAKAVYEDYLRRYPKAEGTEGVRQRLLAIETAESGPSERLRAGTGVTTIGPASIDGAPAGSPQAVRSNASVSGSFSSSYIRDDSYSVNRDPTQALNLNKTKDEFQSHQNEVLSSFDTTAQWGDGNVKMKFRFSGTNEYRIEPTAEDLFGISSLYLDTSVKDWGTTFRLGRQIRNGDGILGRFDGAVFTYQYDPIFGFTTFGGSPVDYRTDMPIKDDRYFYGGALNFGSWKGLDADVYAIEQMDRNILDRQAVGAEFRYNDMTKSAFLTVDYDVHFDKLDAAIFTGTWTLPDKSIIRAGADYRMAPYLTTWNALQGQAFTTIYDLLKRSAYTQVDLMQMAIDRTATYQSANLGYTRQLTDKVQINLDVTQAHINGTIASYTVAGMPDSGDEFYYGAQLIGSSLLTEGDMYSAAFRYSDLKESDNFAADLSVRYPVIQDVRVQPHLIGTYSTGKTGGWSEYTVIPSLLISYFVRKDLNLEIEVGDRMTWRSQGTTQTTENELLITAGVRYDFYADTNTCLTPSAFCR
jgi:tetratricopeptide (TPR) repeat protein